MPADIIPKILRFLLVQGLLVISAAAENGGTQGTDSIPIGSWANARGHADVRLVDASEAPIKGPVWAVTQDAAGFLFVGSNELAVFDGDRWQAIEVKGAYAFR